MTNYDIGARFELATVKDFQKHGWYARRLPGSKGPFDVWAKEPGECGRTAWVQCKTNGKLSKQDWQTLVLLASAFDAIPILAYKDHGIKYGRLSDGNVISDWHPGGEI